ncbi:MAG: HIT family protein [Saprospiraceae bacterium]|nr:HIT family protein [Saprospiraceae bacterium]
MPTLFSRIISGEIPCYRIAESENFLAFLDIRPLANGHTLVIPKRKSDYIFRMDDDELGALMVFAKKVAIELEKEVTCARIGVAVIGLEVPHTHIHLVPINSVGDLNFKNPPVHLSPEEMTDLATRVSSRIAAG